MTDADPDQTTFNLRGGDRAHEANPTEENEMSAATETNEMSDLVVRGESGLALPMEDLFNEQGSGLEEVGSEDVTIPYLSVVQKMSEVVEKQSSHYKPEAEPGMFFNTLTEELYSGEDGLLVVPCYFRAIYTEHAPGKRGKFLSEHPVSTPLAKQTRRNDDGQDVLPNGNVLIRKNRHYVMLAHEAEPVVLTCKATALKTSKKWNSLLGGRKMTGPGGKEFTPPIFSSVWRLTTEKNQNDDGVWFTPKVEMVGDLGDAVLFQKCREFADMVRGGEVREAGEEA